MEGSRIGNEYDIDHYSSNIKRQRKININNLMEPLDMKFEEKGNVYLHHTLIIREILSIRNLTKNFN